jgi:prevent-host-death family protein
MTTRLTTIFLAGKMTMMDVIGLSEAKRNLLEICRKVADGGEAVVITRRGKPLVKIEPVAQKKKSGVLAARARYIKKHGMWSKEDDFELPPREKATWRNPLDD